MLLCLLWSCGTYECKTCQFTEQGNLGHILPSMAAIKVGTLDGCEREMLATWFYGWSELEEEGWGCVHWLPQALERITASISKCMLIKKLDLQVAACKVHNQPPSRERLGDRLFLPVPSMLSPMGTAMVNACTPNMLPLRTASLLQSCVIQERKLKWLLK